MDIVEKLIRFQIFDNQEVILFVYSISIQPLLRAQNPKKREWRPHKPSAKAKMMAPKLPYIIGQV